MVADAEKRATLQQQAVARKHATGSTLRSGNYFIDQKQALESIFKETLQTMEAYALSAVAPGDAARALKTVGLDLESKCLARFEGILEGVASGHPCPDKASEELLTAFRDFAHEQLNQTVTDTSNNVAGKPIRGWKGLVGRYAWNVVNTTIALAALYLAWIKK
jgi:hypothetical protein